MHKCKSFQSPRGHIKIKLNISSHGYGNGSLSKCFQTNKIILSKLSNRKDVFTEWWLFPQHIFKEATDLSSNIDVNMDLFK